MLLISITVAFLLLFFAWLVKGNRSVFTITCDDQWTSHDNFHGNDSHLTSLLYRYCINGNCSNSLSNVVEHLSNDSMINITCDMELPSVITVVGLRDITITGHNNPTVDCNNSGGLHFLSCHNIKVEGIILEKCGFKNGITYPVIKLNKTSAIVIKNCLFQQSVGQVVLMTEVSGDVIIENCTFVNNTKYQGQGSVIYYVSENMVSSLVKLSIIMTSFKCNTGASSIVYLKSSKAAARYQNVTIQNSTFIDNTISSFHLVNQNVHIINSLFSDIHSSENSSSYCFNQTFSFLIDFSSVTFLGHSIVLFDSNDHGAFALYNSNLIFNDSCNVNFNNIDSSYLIYSRYYSNIIFQGKSKISFKNTTSTKSGVILSRHYSSVLFRDNSAVSFNNGKGSLGGAMYFRNYSNVMFEGNSTVSFSNNIAQYGGALFLYYNSNVIIQENSEVSFEYNTALSTSRGGGAVYLSADSSFIFKGNCTVSFNNNTATTNGGAMHFRGYSNIKFKGNSTVSFSNNTVQNKGGALYLYNQSNLIFQDNCKVSFKYNRANFEGGAVFFMSYTSVKLTGYSIVMFKNNTAAMNGGALHGNTNSAIHFDENTVVSLVHNHAAGGNGGAIDLHSNSNISFTGQSTVTFDNNVALGEGGAFVCVSHVSFMDNASINFTLNRAGKHGGAIALLGNFSITFERAKANFIKNTASYGGAVLCGLSKGGIVNFNIQKTGIIAFYNNSARIYGNSVLINIPKACKKVKNCLTYQVMGINKTIDSIQNALISTPPYRIELYMQQYPLICTEFDNAYNDCTEYHIKDAMLGQEITLKGCPYDYFNNPILTETHYKIYSAAQNYTIQFHENASLTCNSSQEFTFSITGNKLLSSHNYSFTITVLPSLSLNFSIQLSPCYPGFQHNSVSSKCECYEGDSIVSCIGPTSTIRRGYWIGIVERKLSTSVCPINYCNFNCRETINGYHSLSPGRENQCTSHRSGVACGSCEEGYTLSYVAECVSVNKCTAGWTVLAVTLTMLYWIVIVIGVFAMMYYKLPIGYLYAITYYYSMVDVLLGQYLYIYPNLHMTISILSSVFKLAPQFLGKVCLMRGLSGIDIQFIQYIHPLAISIILAIISLLARCSQRLSLFIARGIIRVICFLLLLSYTSMVSTSLLLLRSLQFHNVDKVYTYLSPDIEYFHCRHLAYFIVAVMFVITIIFGLPLILLLEPFLNRKVNFTRIKPLLDQFQGCFKNRCRWFAAYYMICRLVQIATVVYSSDYFVTQYILTATTVIVSLVHIIVRPYNKNILNVFDGVILQLMVFVAVVPVFDTVNSTIIVTGTFTLVIVPLLIFLIMELTIHKEALRRFITKTCRAKSTKVTVGVDNQNERSGQEFEMIVDDSMRQNATICDM